MSIAVPLGRIPVSVLVERRKASNPWIDYVWTPSAVLTGVPETAAWTQVSQTPDVTTFYAGSAEIALYRTETGNYRDNLATGEPKLWILLRPTGVEPAYDLLAVTADPAEGESFTEAGNDLVEMVAMPEPIQEVRGGIRRGASCRATGVQAQARSRRSGGARPAPARE